MGEQIMIRSHFLETSRNDTGSDEIGKVVAQREKEVYGQELCIDN